MKILVPVKRVVDANVRVRIDAAGTGIQADGLKMSLNPYDETAVEEAVRFKERGWADEVVAVTIGTTASQDVLRTALALGCDRAILIEAETAPESLAVAAALAALVRHETFDLILAGRQAIDGDHGQTGPMLAQILGWPQAVGASAITRDEAGLTVVCETERGSETLALPLPALISVDLHLNTPRYVSLPRLMKAKKKPLEQRVLADFATPAAPLWQSVALHEPPPRVAGETVADAAAFVAALMAEDVAL